MAVRFTWNGDEVKRREREGRNRGLRLSAEHLLGAALPLVPLRDAILEDSGTASVDESAGTAAVSFDTPYAVRQHEELDYHHPKKGQAKYLEQPMHTEAKTIAAIIAAQIRRSLRG
ncbi:hypothetical protein [Glycomyces arizonensis]|uniref:hypothetical protein n=1 Tax=Glycomyces arizonensis TaxID=256035 RepID=UPI00047D3897|nr:hypothetical protein [Glycomyces arizonensis]